MGDPRDKFKKKKKKSRGNMRQRTGPGGKTYEAPRKRKGNRK